MVTRSTVHDHVTDLVIECQMYECRTREPALPGQKKGSTGCKPWKKIEDRVDALEKHSRLQAQTIAHLNESLEDARRRVFESNTDIDKYKAFIGTVHVTIDNYVNMKVNALQGQIDNVMNVIPSDIDILDYRVKDLEAAMSRLRPNDPATPTGAAVGTNAEHFSMTQAAPNVAAQPAVPEYQAADPWFRYMNEGRLPAPVNPAASTVDQPTAPEANAAGNAFTRYTSGNQQTVPEASAAGTRYVPLPAGTFTGYAQIPASPESPFQGGVRPGFTTPDNNRGPGYGPEIGGAGGNPGISAWAGGKPCIFRAQQEEERFALHLYS